MRLAFAACAVLGLGLGGCDNGKSHLHPEAGMDAAPPPWWRPTLGEAKDWDIQLNAPFELTTRNTMYDLNLWDVVPAATPIDYGDGMPVTVPAGVLAGKIAELHARNVKVVCHIDTGAIHLTKDPDANKFPGHEVTPVPNDPDPPAAGSVIGWSIDDTVEEKDHRFLDTREASRSAWAPIMWKRFDLAKQIGCDGIDADRNLATAGTTGFDIQATDTFSWHRAIAKEAHDRVMGVGMRNGTSLPNLVEMVGPDFDVMFSDGCGEAADCGLFRTFLDRGRVVFAIDYQGSFEDATCLNQQQGGVTEGLIKDVAISSLYRRQCTP